MIKSEYDLPTNYFKENIYREHESAVKFYTRQTRFFGELWASGLFLQTLSGGCSSSVDTGFRRPKTWAPEYL